MTKYNIISHLCAFKDVIKFYLLRGGKSEVLIPYTLSSNVIKIQSSFQMVCECGQITFEFDVENTCFEHNHVFLLPCQQVISNSNNFLFDVIYR